MEILLEQGNNQNNAAGWRILFLQAGENGKGIRDIPIGESQVQGDKFPRPDIVAGKSAIEYLAIQLQESQDPTSPYHGESGMTLEEWIVAFMAHLEETERPMDDFGAGNSIVYLTGAFLSAALDEEAETDRIPTARWYRFDQQAGLFVDELNVPSENITVRFAMRA
ncbi:hypothetical protein EPN81_00750 [Patescibacteria group bacterium]|nr:MAG: hypothetical protein EPN81_00750 [Patescibacteria group bacterium]